MCKNAKIPSKARLRELLGEMDIPDYEGCENANSFDHPDVPVITNFEPGKVNVASWGLIPEWIRDSETAKKMANTLRNARAESIFEKPSFAPYIRGKRCLIFLEGFYEWQHLDAKGNPEPKGKKKQPYYIEMKDKKIFATGGIWTQYGNTKTCCLITTAANPLLAQVHNDGERQPLILDPKKWQQWLDNKATEDQIKALLQVYPDTNMQASKIDNDLPKDVGGEQQSLF